MDDIGIPEIKNLLNQQTRDFSAELEAITWQWPELRWWEMVSGILAAILLVGLSFIGGVLFYLYLFDVPCN